MKRTIQQEEWSIRFLTEDMLGKIIHGDVTVIDHVLSHDWTQVSSEPSEEPESLVALAIYEAHAIAAASGQSEIASAFYGCGELQKITWNSSDIDSYPSRVCPVCFKLNSERSLDARLDCAEGHLVFRSSSDLQTYELKGAEEIDATVFSNVTSESGNFEEVEGVLFADDVVGRALRLAADEEMWFKVLPGGDKLHIFSEVSNEDSWGDTFLYGYHPDGSRFVDVIMDYYQQMIERCQECGLDACDDYF